MGDREEVTCGIYEIRHAATGRLYIGSSKDIEARWRKHLSDLRLGRHVNSALQKDFQRSPHLGFRIVRVTSERGLLAAERSVIESCSHLDLYNENSVKDMRGLADRLWDIDRAFTDAVIKGDE